VLPTKGQKKLADGAKQLSTGVTALTTGVRAMNNGIRTMVSKLPEDAQLDELGNGAVTLANGANALADGTQKLKVGSDRLEAGMELMTRALPETIDAPEGSAEGLATSVRPILEVESAVANSGSAFAANLIPAALWLGAGVAAFLIHVRVLPRQAQRFLHPAQLMGKMAIPTAIVLAQSLLVFATLRWVLGIQVLDPWAFMVCLLLSSLTFLCIVFAMTRALGDAGKALAMIFLAVQLSSSGGILPVELSGSLFCHHQPVVADYVGGARHQSNHVRCLRRHVGYAHGHGYSGRCGGLLCCLLGGALALRQACHRAAGGGFLSWQRQRQRIRFAGAWPSFIAKIAIFVATK